MKRKTNHAFYDVLQSPVGPLYLVFSGAALTGISFEIPAGAVLRRSDSVSTAKKELAEYFKKGRREFSCETAFLEGTEFERAVWTALKEVPFGETRTYKWLAESLGRPKASRAVGGALGKNPIPIIFPCHRIVESGGSLGGYSAGVEIKRRLLDLEYYTASPGLRG